MGDEAHNSLVVIHDHDRRADVRIAHIEPFDPVTYELRIGGNDRRIVPRVGLGRAVGRVVPRGDALHHDVPVRDRAEVAAIFGIVHDGHDGDVLGAHQQGHLGAGGAGGGDEWLGDHDFAGEHYTS